VEAENYIKKPAHLGKGPVFCLQVTKKSVAGCYEIFIIGVKKPILELWARLIALG
jgi:hypothetical protein